MKFIHCSDLHVDSPLTGLDRYEGAPVSKIRGATRRALSNLVELCIEEDAELLLIAGDVYDGDWRDYGTGLFFAAQMSRLREAGVRVAMVLGNHDAQSQITRALRLPDNVIVFDAAAPATHVLDDVKADLSQRQTTAVRGAFDTLKGHWQRRRTRGGALGGGQR